MTKKRILVSTFLAGALYMGGTFPVQAQVASPAVLGDWSLAKIDRAAQGGQSYCTLSRKYDNGLVLSVGRNLAEEYSVALDFQKDMFTKDKPVNVNLQPGPGKLRAYDLLPASEKAVVVRLGWDEGFFESLGQSGNMTVKLDDAAYALPMPKMAEGQKDLENCIDEIKTAQADAPVAPSTDVLAAGPVQGAKGFEAGRKDAPLTRAQVEQQEKAVLQNFAKNVQQDEAKKAAGASVKLSNINKAPAPERIAPAAGMPGPAPIPVAVPSPVSGESDAAAKAQIAALEKQNAGLQSSVASLKEAERAGADMKRQIADLQAQNKALASQSQTANDAATRLAAAEKENTALKTKMNELAVQASGSAQAASELSALNKTVQDLRRQNDALQAQVKTGSAAQVSEAAKLSEMQAKLDAMAKENAGLKDQAAKSATAVSAATGTEKARITKLEQELASYRSRLDSPTTITALPADDERIAVLEKKVRELQANNAALEQSARAQAAKLAAVPAESPAQAARIASLETQNQSLQKSLEAAQAATRASAGAGDQAQKLSARVAELETANAALAKNVLEAQTAAKAGGDASAAEVIKLTKRVSELEALNAMLTASASATPKDDPAQAERIANLEKRAEELQQKLAAAGASAGASNAAEAKQLAAAQEQVKVLEIKNAQLEDTLRNAQTRIGEAAINTESRALKEIASLEARLKSAQDDNTRLARELESQQSGQDNKRLQLVAGDWDLEKATKRFNESEREVRRLGLSLEQARMTCNQEKREIEQMLFDPAVTERKQIDRLVSLESELREAKAQLASYQSGAAQPVAAVAMAASSQVSGGSSLTAMPGGEAAPMPVSQMSGQRTRVSAQPNVSPVEPAPMKNIVPALASVEPASGSATPISATAKAAVAAPVATPPVQKAAAPAYDAAGAVKGVLHTSGVYMGEVRKIGAPLIPGAQSFSWTAPNGVKGVSAVKAIDKGAKFDALVSQYIDAEKIRCGGDFASMPSPSSASGNVAFYETACVGGSADVSASTVFFEKDGHFVAISSQADPAEMDSAMDARDKIASRI